ncbi:FlaA1/EpsC-like NDP-sugar epimerase [Humibacillus xanthopallidus]|uniref:FlaA1/EpsC-like NDP-sugar epimerase n=1 Tax=Humibacillus xanthopallidus TaxID=412689 RepID=A0A543PPQ8_9MICO|nr:nucleoside-diphosphate sugar epimerase/dehydratase [Humibacillus xanthopallidus]TQN46061.1 FlaA1/EpsC-like NDP-sugar epimerase [Humibacillus xanthopallidus]
MTTEVMRHGAGLSSVPGSLRTLVVGAGEAGKALARDLQHVPDFGLTPIGFLDDDPAKTQVRHLPVLGTLTDLLQVCTAHRVDVVVLAIPGLPEAEVQRLATTAARVGASVRRLPSFVRLLQRDVVGTDLRSLDVATLIGRNEVHVASPEAASIIRDRVVLVTGAGGSIGSELCRQVNGFGPARLVMLDHDESNLHRLQLELHGEAFLDSHDVVVADIRDAGRMRQVMEAFRPQVVFHAAALKHLPMLEEHPCEGVKSNVQGTDNVLCAAVDCDVERFVVISTDKAADPTSVLGATKALAELVVKAHTGGRTVVSAVRFGNVLGSRGSLLPVLVAQMANGREVTVTHPDVTRYFMTIEEAVGLVLESAYLTTGGETFVLDMGAPVRIVDLVASFARQLEVPDVGIRFTGLRPGEKLHEALFSESEECFPTSHPRIFAARAVRPCGDFERHLHWLYEAAGRNAADEVRRRMVAALPDFRPDGDDSARAPAAIPSTWAPYPDDY